MKRKVTVGKIIGTVICSLIFIGGIIVIALNIDAETAFPTIGGILLVAFGGGCLLSIWFPLDGASKTNVRIETSEERAERKAQLKAARDIAIAAMLVDDEIRSRKKKDKKENVWEDNSEDNDDADPDNW
ncbi:MAG: hypothetical protein PHX51_02115 [Clostridia bacterium]|nr:hypothetical protein [Clostridia bacterium]